MSIIDLTHLGITRPEKISWVFPKTTDVLGTIKSKSTRKSLANLDQILEEHGIHTEWQQISKAEYLQWLPIYRLAMEKKNFQVFATEATFDNWLAAGKTVMRLYLYQGEQIVGTAIAAYNNQECGLHFKTVGEVEFSGKNQSLGSMIEYLYLQWAVQLGTQLVHSGSARNEFGVVNTFGYLDSKLRMGYVPQPFAATPIHTEVHLNDQEQVVFLGLNQDQPVMYAIQNGTDQDLHYDFEVYLPESLPLQFLHKV